MTQPGFAIGFAAIVGAMLFFLAGYFFFRFRFSAHARASDFDDGLDETEAVPISKAPDSAGGGHWKKRSQRPESEGDWRDRRIEKLKHSLKAQAFARRKHQRERLKLEEQTWALICKLEELTANRVAADTYHQMELELERLQDLEKQGRAILEEKTALAGELDGARREIMELKTGLQAEQARADELTRRVELLNTQLSNMDALKERNTRLEAVAMGYTKLRKLAVDLRAENSKLRSQGLVPASALHRPPVFNSKTLGSSLQSLVERLIQTQGTRAVVLADEQGLLVAGAGVHNEGLAVAAALFDESVRKARSILPLSASRKLMLTDENSVTLAARPLQVSSGHLILASLSIGTAPATQPAKQPVSRLPKS